MHMHMSFWWGADVGDVFFPGLTVSTTGAMVALCVTLTVLSIVYEGLKVHGAKVRARAARERKRSGSCPPSESATLLSLESAGTAGRLLPLSRRFCAFFAEATIFLFHNMLGYALMLMVMFYNGYLFVAVVGGMALGYFFFGHLSMKVNMENVQARRTNVICTARCLQTDSVNPSASSSLEHDHHHQLGTNELNYDGTEPSTSSSTAVVIHHQHSCH